MRWDAILIHLLWTPLISSSIVFPHSLLLSYHFHLHHHRRHLHSQIDFYLFSTLESQSHLNDSSISMSANASQHMYYLYWQGCMICLLSAMDYSLSSPPLLSFNKIIHRSYCISKCFHYELFRITFIDDGPYSIDSWTYLVEKSP